MKIPILHLIVCIYTILHVTSLATKKITTVKKEVLLECPLSDSTIGCSDSIPKIVLLLHSVCLALRIAQYCGGLHSSNISDSS